MTDKVTDPAELWRQFIGEMEKGVNSFANQAAGSADFSRLMNQAGGAAAGAQKQFGELMERWLLAANLPSRAQMVGIAERLQAIEAQLNDVRSLLQQMRTEAGASGAGQPNPKPPRTRRPPQPSSGERT